MKINRKLVLVLALILSVAMATGGTLAYLTDRDTEENTFTMGNVIIDVVEDFTPRATLYPGVTVNKDAWIENKGTNPAWVWMTVSMPATLKDYVTPAWANGFQQTSDSPAVVGDKAVWTVLVPDALAVGGKTDAILDSVTLSPLVDYQGGKYVVVSGGQAADLIGLNADGTLDVTVDGYAVQADAFDSVEKARRAYQVQWGEMPSVLNDDRAEYNGTIYDDIYEAVAAANANGGGTITLMGSAKLDKPVEIASNITIEGNSHQYTREDGFTGTMFTVKAGATLKMDAVVLDGAGAAATGNLIATESNAHIVLNEGTVLKNNNGAHAVHLGTRIGATLTMNGAEISNNTSDSGAIWGGGNITVNAGSKINNNHSTGSAGAIRMVSKCNLTMNGGEICGNTAEGDGGAIWGYGSGWNDSSTYNFHGGKMSGNTAKGVGGGIYTGNYSTINISGDFEMCNNTAADSGAMRVTNYTTVSMDGGKIADNTSTGNSSNDGFYGWCPILTLSSGELSDDIYLAGGHTPTVGGTTGNGVIHFSIGTTHNTVNLVENFGTFKFTVAEGENFAAFNLKPAAGYTYQSGDEAKLQCQNPGYSTYWNAEQGVFKIKAN